MIMKLLNQINMIFPNVIVSKLWKISKISNREKFSTQNSSFLIRKVKTDYSNRFNPGLGSDSGLGLEINSIY